MPAFFLVSKKRTRTILLLKVKMRELLTQLLHKKIDYVHVKNYPTLFEERVEYQTTKLIFTYFFFRYNHNFIFDFISIYIFQCSSTISWVYLLRLDHG